MEVTLTSYELFFLILVIAVATTLTRFFPFLLFSTKRGIPPYLERLRSLLPSAVIGLLVVYCLKDVELFAGTHGLPEWIALVTIGFLHLSFKQTLVSIAGGTLVYMLLVQFIF